MERLRLFLDFGSTFTKAALFDMEGERLAGWAKAPSTVDTDVTEGLENALRELRGQTSFSEDTVRQAVACSSAAGGLRVVCIGLTPELTTKAGRIAAFGAGAKIVGSYSRRLQPEDMAAICALRPDIVLLCGGTEGGDRKGILHNGRLLSGAPGVENIIVAGNKAAYAELEDLFADSGKLVRFTGNVMPDFGKLVTEPANREIRDLFLGRITQAKGIDRVRARIGSLLMPTPSAVLEAAKLAAGGIAEGEPGLGDLMIVDVGGATTDVYSVADGYPSIAGVNPVGLMEPRVKRTVEGDLGLYHNLDTLCACAQDAPAMLEDAKNLRNAFSVPEDEASKNTHLVLTQLAVRLAVERHCGSLLPVGMGEDTRYVQQGKDLSLLPLVIGAGGPVAFSSDPAYVLRGAVKREEDGLLLKPRVPRFCLDDRYILFAAGLMAQSAPETALHILKSCLRPIEDRC